MDDDAQVFEGHRAKLLAHAYRMLGDWGRAEDIVQDAWVRWQRREVVADSPRAYLIKTVTRLCVNELESARVRREENRSNHLPEPIDLRLGTTERAEILDSVSMAFLVLLQRLTANERAALLLHDVFDFEHGEIATVLGKTEAASRQLLKRARESVASARRTLKVSREEHLRLLRAFMKASNQGRLDELTSLLAEDAVLISDGGIKGVRIGKVRNVGKPVEGAKKIAAVVASLATRGPPLEHREWELNGQPAIVALLDGKPVFAILLAVADGKIRDVFIHADPERLSHLGWVN